jgi:hypothetical protein
MLCHASSRSASAICRRSGLFSASYDSRIDAAVSRVRATMCSGVPPAKASALASFAPYSVLTRSAPPILR